MTEFFPFADLIEDFEALPIVAYVQGGKDTYTTAGRKVPATETQQEIHGVLAPFSFNALRMMDNGEYTEKDRQLFALSPVELGTVVEQDGQKYKVDKESPYSQWTDIFIYYAKGWNK